MTKLTTIAEKAEQEELRAGFDAEADARFAKSFHLGKRYRGLTCADTSKTVWRAGPAAKSSK